MKVDEHFLKMYLRLILSILLFVVFVLLIILIGTMLAYLFFTRSPQEIISSDEIPHRSLRYDPSNGERNHGIVHLPEEKESHFYEGNGGYFLISNFDTSEYQCSGSCFCDDSLSERKSGSSSVFIRSGLVFLVGAFTSIIAHQKAHEYFESKCTDELKDDECDSVFSMVENCELIYFAESSTSSGSIGDDTSNPEGLLEGRSSDGRVFQPYMCTGHCLHVSSYDMNTYSLEAAKLGGIDPLAHLSEKEKDVANAEMRARYEKLLSEVECDKLQLSKVYDLEFLSKWEVKSLNDIFGIFSIDLNYICLKDGTFPVKMFGDGAMQMFCEGYEGGMMYTLRNDVSPNALSKEFLANAELKKNPTIKCVKIEP